MITLYTDSSPNGFKVTITLEELGLLYKLQHVQIDRGDNRQPDFLKLNPHGVIPVLVDEETEITLFESAAILMYLAEKTDRLLPTTPKERWQALQWLIFHSASVGPLMGQRVYFEIFAKDKNSELINRYRTLTHKAFCTINGHLASGQPYFAGDEYSIADIAHFGWMHIAKIINFDFSEHRYLSAWYERVAKRPAVQKGITLPAPATGA